MHLLTSFAVLVILTQRNAEAGQHCLSCNEVPTPQSCTHVTICGDHESCFTESIISSSGTVFYNVGCMSKLKCSSSQITKRDAIVTCIECCDTDFCNVQGCGISAVPKDKRGPYCYQCDIQESQNSCRDVTVCGIDEACILEPNRANLPDTYYRSRCGEKYMCLKAQHIHNNGQSTPNPAELIVGKRISTFGDCPACCYTDFCNNNCSQNNSVAVHGITEISTSITITTHPELMNTTKLVTDVHQHHTSMPSTTLTQSTKHQTLVTEATHLGTHLHPEQTSTHGPSITHAAQECSQVGSGYIQTRHLCIKFHSESKNFKDAATTCSNEGAMLVTIDTADKMNEIWTELQTFSKVHIQDLWIGGSDVNHTDTFYWQNGVEVRPYTNWGTHQQQPDDPHYHDQDCIILHRLDNYTWYDEPCYRVYGFICEHPFQDVLTSTRQTTSCESQDGFHQLEHNLACVMYVQTAMDWQSATNYCTRHQSHLVTINSQKKQDAIHRFATSRGLTRMNDCKIHVRIAASSRGYTFSTSQGIQTRTDGTNDFPWIGLSLPHNLHHWRWESGLPLTYNNWAANHPEGPGTCVVMMMNGHWRNKICSSYHPFICQKY